MPWCPNAACPHRRYSRRPAEYQPGVETCPECGTALVDDPEAAGLASGGGVPRATRPRLPAPLQRRLLVTGGVAVALWLTGLVPLPLIDREAFFSAAGFWYGSTVDFSLAARGITPVLAAFVVVELVALCFPRWRRRRHGDPAFRRRLDQVAIGFGLLLALAGGVTLAMSLESFSYLVGSGTPVVPAGWGPRLLIGTAGAGGTCLFVLGALVIRRHGVGSGFAVVLLIQAAFRVPQTVNDWRVALDLVGPVGLAILAVPAVALFVLAVGLLRRRDRRPGALPLRLPTCGTFPLEVAYLVGYIPATLAGWFLSEWLQEWAAALYEDSLVFLGVEVGLMVLLAPTFSVLFYWHHRERLRGRPEWRGAILASASVLLVMIAVPFLLGPLAAGANFLLPSALTALVLSALTLDLVAEIRARSRAPGGGDLVAGPAHHDVADAVEAARAAESDVVVVQGLYYRSLTYLFGPFVPMVVLRPRAESAE